MIFSSFLRSSTCTLAASALFFSAGCAVAPSATSPSVAATSPGAATPPPAASGAAYPSPLDLAVTAAGTDRAKVRALVAELVALLQNPATDALMRQEASEHLGRLAWSASEGDAVLSALAPLLSNPAEVNRARLVLEPVPGAAVDTLFLNALGQASGATRLALIQSIGNRRMGAAVPALATAMKDTDAVISAAATQALGQIGNGAALAALLNATDPTARPVVEARLDAAWQLPATEGKAAMRAIRDDTRIAVAQRAAAFRGLLALEPETAAAQIADVLSTGEKAFVQVAIEAIPAQPTPGLIASLAGKLSSWDASTQEAVIAAFGRKGDAAALPAVIAATTHENAGVRTAAFEALSAFPGNANIVDRLAKSAASASGEEAATALRSLSRVNGPGVSQAILANAGQGEPALRSVYLEVIGLRNLAEGLPLLFATRNDANVDVRSAALSALTEIAPPASQADLLAWTIAATDGREATRALRAYTSVSLRNLDLATRDRLLVEAIDQGSPEVKLRLLPLLARLPGAMTRECAGRLALGADERVSAAMLAQLQRWPDSTVLPLFVSIAEKTTSGAVRKTAIESALRILEQARGLPAAEQSALVAVLFGTTKDVELRKQLVATMGRGTSPFALTFVESLQGDAALADVVETARASITANQKWPPVITVSTNAAQLPNLVDGRPQSPWRVSLDGEQWVQLDLKESRPLRRLTLDQTGRGGEYPTEYKVFVSDDPASMGAAVVSGSGQRDRTVIDLPAGTKGRYLKITNSEQRENASWTISELFID